MHRGSGSVLTYSPPPPPAQAAALPSGPAPAPGSSCRGWTRAPWRPELRPTWRRWFAGRAPHCACAPRTVRVEGGAFPGGGGVGVQLGYEVVGELGGPGLEGDSRWLGLGVTLAYSSRK